MKESDIIEAIEQRVGKKYSIWTIGITDNPDERRTAHNTDGKDTMYWKQWEADSEEIARNIERHFLDEGMKGGVVAARILRMSISSKSQTRSLTETL